MTRSAGSVREPLVLAAHAGCGAEIGGRLDAGHAGARDDFDIGLAQQRAAAQIFDERAGLAEHVDADVASRQRIVSRKLDIEVAVEPRLDRALIDKLPLDPGKEARKRGAPSGEKDVGMAILRRPGARFRAVRQRIAIENDHPFEERRYRLGCGEAADARSDDDGLFCDRTHHPPLSISRSPHPVALEERGMSLPYAFELRLTIAGDVNRRETGCGRHHAPHG